jgi:hypothetical protein
MNGIWRSLCSVRFETYHGALVMERGTFDWNRWSTFVFDGLVHPQSWIPYVQIGFRTHLYTTILFSSESLEFRPRSQDIWHLFNKISIAYKTNFTYAECSLLGCDIMQLWGTQLSPSPGSNSKLMYYNPIFMTNKHAQLHQCQQISENKKSPDYFIAILYFTCNYIIVFKYFHTSVHDYKLRHFTRLACED